MAHDKCIRNLGTIEHAQVQLFILAIWVPHAGSFDA